MQGVVRQPVAVKMYDLTAICHRLRELPVPMQYRPEEPTTAPSDADLDQRVKIRRQNGLPENIRMRRNEPAQSPNARRQGVTVKTATFFPDRA